MTRAAHLEKARELARVIPDDPAVRDYPDVCLAEQRWREGAPGEARRRVVGPPARPGETGRMALYGPKASEFVRRIRAREPERAALRRAERAARGRGDLESRCGLVLAHVAAGHPIEADRMANGLCRSHPGEPLAWATLARVLEADGRYRDAVAPARKALARGSDDAADRVLLARILSRLGPDGREESAALAVAAIEAHPEEARLRSHELAEAVRIAHDGGADLDVCRRGDDEVWALRATDEPPEEWLGAAVARRCDGVWAADAPEWLARLAAVAFDEPAELARFVVERVEALQHLRLLIARSLLGAVEGLEAEAAAYARAGELLKDRHGLCIEAEGVVAVAVAAVSLGVGEPDPDVEVGPALNWRPHLAAIDAGLGMDLAVGLRASELAQAALLTADGAGERDRIVQLHTIERERGDWIRWAGAEDRLRDLAEGFGGGLSTGTAARLEPVLSCPRDDEQFRATVWATRRHEAERR